MTPQEAIDILQSRIDGEYSITPPDTCEDMKLAIVALQEQQQRQQGHQP